MGRQTSQRCRACGTAFSVRDGGGFFFDELHCDDCGAATSVGHRDLGDIHLRYVKGLGMPYAMVRAEMDRRIQQEYPGEPLSRGEYLAAVEGGLGPCPCGGRFRYDAPPRCPGCRSTEAMWDVDEAGGEVFYD